MDMELKQELDKINGKLGEVDAKLDKNVKDGNKLTFAVVGFSIAMLGIATWFQKGMWSSIGNFLIIYGTAIMITMAFIDKEGFKKWINIVIKVLTGLFIVLVVAIVIIMIVS